MWQASRLSQELLDELEKELKNAEPTDLPPAQSQQEDISMYLFPLM